MAGWPVKKRSPTRTVTMPLSCRRSKVPWMKTLLPKTIVISTAVFPRKTKLCIG